MLWLDRLRPRAAQEAAEDGIVSGRGAGGVPGLHRTPGRSPHPHQRAGGLPGVPPARLGPGLLRVPGLHHGPPGEVPRALLLGGRVCDCSQDR